jgi:hypothetical protein
MLMAWKIFDEAIDMVERRHRYFPRVFRWRGQRFEVETIDRSWTTVRGRGKRRVERHVFQVQCRAGTFELYQDIRSNTWHLRRAKLAMAPVAVPQRLAPAWR